MVTLEAETKPATFHSPELVQKSDGWMLSPEEMTVEVDHLITEDDTPVDNFFSEYQMRLLIEPLKSGWRGGPDNIPFVAAANVGIFARPLNPALVPDAFLSLDVTIPENLHLKKNRSYMIWEYGKPPEVVVEVVSNREGGEDSSKLRKYAQMKVENYVIFDPYFDLSDQILRVFELRQGEYRETRGRMELHRAGLRLDLWEGMYEGSHAVWLRWFDLMGNLIPTGAEQAAKERANAEKERANAEKERERADRLAAKLQALGLDAE